MVNGSVPCGIVKNYFVALGCTVSKPLNCKPYYTVIENPDPLEKNIPTEMATEIYFFAEQGGKATAKAVVWTE